MNLQQLKAAILIMEREGATDQTVIACRILDLPLSAPLTVKEMHIEPHWDADGSSIVWLGIEEM